MATKLIGKFDIFQTGQLGHKITGIRLIISTRKKASPSKPLNFLLLVLPSGKRQYISSLYPDLENKAENALKSYLFEWQGIGYRLTVEEYTGQIDIAPKSIANKLAPENCTIPINNVQLGALNTPKYPPNDKV